MAALVGILVGIIVALIMFLYGVICWGFVTLKFYGWFILPIFPQLGTYTVLQFIGVMLFLSVILPKSTLLPIKEEFKESTTKIVAMGIVYPWFVLFLGWVVHLFLF